MDNPMAGGAQEVTGPDAKALSRNAMGIRALLNPEKYGIKYELKGKEKVGETECYVMSTVFKDGFTAKSYYDTKTFLLVKSAAKVETSQGAFNNESFFSDYKKTDGITSAHTIKIVRDGAEFLQMTVTEITYNTDISDDDFKMKQ